MDDLAKKLNDLLSSPDGMQKIQHMASSLGMLSPDSGENSVASSPAESVPTGAPPPPSAGGPLGDMELIKKLMPLVSNLKSDDENTILLRALRPYLKDDRQQRLDESIKIMQLLKVLPMLNDKDIF